MKFRRQRWRKSRAEKQREEKSFYWELARTFICCERLFSPTVCNKLLSFAVGDIFNSVNLVPYLQSGLVTRLHPGAMRMSSRAADKEQIL